MGCLWGRKSGHVVKDQGSVNECLQENFTAANCQKPVKIVVSSAITIMWDADKDIQTNINDYFANSTPYTCDFYPGVTCNASPRQMLWDNPPVVFMEAFNYPHNFASTITIQGTEYSLCHHLWEWWTLCRLSKSAF